MKCGREIALGQVFCKECLADMSEYPIKPGTPVPLYAQPEPTTQPKRSAPVRKPKKPEEQIVGLKKWLFGLSMALMAVMLIFSITTAILVHQLNEARDTPQAGQNYSTIDSSK
jgi:hypothetical protein